MRGTTECSESNVPAVTAPIEPRIVPREPVLRTGKHPGTRNFRRLDDMSGCYDYEYKCGNDWDYDNCHKPKRRRRQKRYDNCWDSYKNCS